MSIIHNINTTRQLFRNNLSGIYEQNEIDSIYSLVIEHVFHFNRSYQLVNGLAELEDDGLKKTLTILDQLKTKEPIQYIIGRTEFYDLKFNVNKNVLIPRQETELLVDYIIKENLNKSISILDIGTGSGCIAISLKKNLQAASVSALDISNEALKVAESNAELNNVDVNFLHADILDSNLTLEKFDLIVSNPPYVKEDEKTKMHDNVLDYEPHLALFVPNSSALKYYTAISKFAKNHLIEGGSVWVEINEALGKETADVFQKDGFLQTNILQDLNGKDRIIRASRK